MKSPEFVSDGIQVLVLWKKHTLTIWRATRYAGTDVREETKAETNKLIPNRKETPFPGKSGQGGRELGSNCAAGTKREWVSGCVWEAGVPAEGRGSQRALADRGLPQAARSPLTKESLSIATWKPFFGQSRVGKVDEAESCVSGQKGKVNELMLRCEGPREMRLLPAVGVCFPWEGQPGRLLGTAGFLWSVLTLWDREIRRYRASQHLCSSEGTSVAGAGSWAVSPASWDCSPSCLRDFFLIPGNEGEASVRSGSCALLHPPLSPHAGAPGTDITACGLEEALWPHVHPLFSLFLA